THGPVQVRACAFFLAGYVAVWGLTAWPAFGLTELSAAFAHGRAAIAVAVAAFAGLALNQLSPWKQRCLRRCRPPFGLLLRYSSWRGRLRAGRAGAHHALSCVGCCWVLMALLSLLGLMSVVPMSGAAVGGAGGELWGRGGG